MEGAGQLYHKLGIFEADYMYSNSQWQQFPGYSSVTAHSLIFFWSLYDEVIVGVLAKYLISNQGSQHRNDGYHCRKLTHKVYYYLSTNCLVIYSCFMKIKADLLHMLIYLTSTKCNRIIISDNTVDILAIRFIRASNRNIRKIHSSFHFERLSMTESLLYYCFQLLLSSL